MHKRILLCVLGFYAMHCILFKIFLRISMLLLHMKALMVAHTESLYGIHTFNGCYSGVIHMQREDVHIVIDYGIVRAPKWTDAFTTEKPKPITLSKVLL